jgi:peptide deformylase
MAEVEERDSEQRSDPVAEARRRAALAQIRQYGDPALRLRAREVDTFDGDLHRLVERMRALMEDANGAGLAANQVGVLQRVVLVQIGDDEPATALVNPRIVARSEETAVEEEGCLSLAGVTVPVERALTVTVEAQDERGEVRTLELHDLPARAAQHEVDHVDGVLMLDRTTPEARREALAVLRPRTILTA